MKKILMLGDPATGKSSILSYYLKDRKFLQNHYPTLGVQAGVKTIMYDNDQYGLVQFWDTAGKVSFHDQVCTNYYKGTDGFLIVISKSDKKTLDTISDWIGKIRKHTDSRTYQIGILANKKDYDQNNSPLFDQRDVKKLYGNEIMYYEQVSLKQENKDGQQKITNTQKALRKFIKQIYGNNLLKVVPQYHIDNQQNHPEQVNSCSCQIM